MDPYAVLIYRDCSWRYFKGTVPTLKQLFRYHLPNLISLFMYSVFDGGISAAVGTNTPQTCSDGPWLPVFPTDGDPWGSSSFDILCFTTELEYKPHSHWAKVKVKQLQKYCYGLFTYTAKSLARSRSLEVGFCLFISSVSTFVACLSLLLSVPTNEYCRG